MTLSPYLLAIDQGTTSSRAIVFDRLGKNCITSQKELSQIYPADGWVEHDPEEIWQTTLAVCRESLSAIEQSPVAIGITNQRETIVLWERATGRTVHNAIVWQDRRTAKRCEGLRNNGHEPFIKQKTGLLLDPYFSATKISWLLDNVEGARIRAQAGELAVGTIDSFLLWRLTGGKVHATDATNASRTLLFNIHSQQWDPELLSLFDIPESLLPDIRDCADDYGYTDTDLLGSAIPICGIAGDQQAALFGQACFESGMAKNTYGTGCFMMSNTGSEPVQSNHGLLTTIAWQIDSEVTYALEGSVFIAGALVQWLRDGLQLFSDASETQAIAESVADSGGVFVVPAFVGLGAPHWDPYARGTIVGLNRDTNRGHIVRASLEAIAFQSAEVLRSIANDTGQEIRELRIDGGAAANDFLCRFQADILGMQVRRPKILETTAMGAAFLAGLSVGVWQDQEQISKLWQQEKMFAPRISGEESAHLMEGWGRAVERAKGWIVK